MLPSQNTNAGSGFEILVGKLEWSEWDYESTCDTCLIGIRDYFL